MKARIWIQQTAPKKFLAQLEHAAEVLTGGDPEELPGADAAMIGSIVTADGNFMDKAGPTLKAIVRPGIGLDNVDLPAATDRGILVVNTPDGPTESTAEHTVALLMALAKRIVAGDMSLRTKELDRSELFGTQLRERVLGLVGFGRIGRRVAEICACGLKMKVLAYDPYVGHDEPVERYVEMVNHLPELLQRGDIISLHTPLTSDTYHFMGEDEFNSMKMGAYLINASRGSVVDEQALVGALESGHLGGAALDVFDPEPPMPGNPLFRFHQVVLTPHIASYTDLATQAMWECAVAQLFQLLQGEQPTHLANPAAWPGRIKT